MDKSLFIPATKLAAFTGNSTFDTIDDTINTLLDTYYYKLEPIVIEEELTEAENDLLLKVTSSDNVSTELTNQLNEVRPEIKQFIQMERGKVKEDSTISMLNEQVNEFQVYPNEAQAKYYYYGDMFTIGGIIDSYCYDADHNVVIGFAEIKNRMKRFYTKQQILSYKCDLYQLLTYYKTMEQYLKSVVIPLGITPQLLLVQCCNGKLEIMNWTVNELDELWTKVYMEIQSSLERTNLFIIDREINMAN